MYRIPVYRSEIPLIPFPVQMAFTFEFVTVTLPVLLLPTGADISFPEILS